MLPPIKAVQPTPPTPSPQSFDRTHIQHAISQAQIGFGEGGVPIGAVLVSASGVVLGVGRNRRVQNGSSIRHGEMDCLENIGRLPATAYKGCTMFTTLSPCTMCAGAIILFGIERVVMGENSTFVGGEDILRERGVEIVNLDLPECKTLMAKFRELKPDVWNEDIGQV
ncbi:cytidine deaminase-like protein [Gautieria morchelliformis]|nr:cytidine deaminase-like protein [Gautieria morchelliformis]